MYWHRRSIDFDFFTANSIDTDTLYFEISEWFSGEEIIKTFAQKNTLYVEIRAIKFSFFTYSHQLLFPLVPTEYMDLANKLDIASMKLWAIQNRATNKDYVDLYFLIQEFWLRELLDAFFRKYGKVVSESLILKSLVYFDDIIEEPLTMNNSVTFEEVKIFLRKEILGFGR